jgi:2,4-dienoyl-CoA reductase-like NADH-dependent reductase (Old Yellow Enzyme family)
MFFMSKLFESGKINGMELSNRFVRSAAWEGMAAAVHKNGGKIVMQIAHAGHFAVEQLTGLVPWVASDFEGLAKTPRHEMTVDDIRDLTVSFAEAAKRAKVAGFDGVQIHSAHGYLLSQFLSPLYNRRKDDYGGGIENRARIHLGVLRAVRKAVGDDFPILAKLNCSDSVEDAVGMHALSDMTRIVPGREKGPLFSVHALRSANVGILVTGTEVFRGLIEDKFIPIIRNKVENLGSRVANALIAPDEKPAIQEGIQCLLDAGADLIITTAGLSVDPDDVTRQALIQAGVLGQLLGENCDRKQHWSRFTPKEP